MPARENWENRRHSTAYIPFSIYECRIPEEIRNVPLHWHDEFEINRILRGRGEFICQDDKVVAGAGDLLVLPPDTLHAAYPLEGEELIYQALVFSPAMLGADGNDRCAVEYLRPMVKGSIRPTVLICPGVDNYRELMETADRIFSQFNSANHSVNQSMDRSVNRSIDRSITQSKTRRMTQIVSQSMDQSNEELPVGMVNYENGESAKSRDKTDSKRGADSVESKIRGIHERSPREDLLLKSDLLRFFGMLPCVGQELCEENSVSYTEMIRPALEFMVENFREPISVEMLAGFAHLSKSYFMSCFKKAAGIGAIEYLAQLRINAACRMLTDTTASISDIAYHCGYNNLSNFNRQFRSVAGCSPREYRRSRD